MQGWDCVGSLRESKKARAPRDAGAGCRSKKIAVQDLAVADKVVGGEVRTTGKAELEKRECEG